MTHDDVMKELQMLGFGSQSEPESIDGLAIHHARLMLGYLEDVSEFIPREYVELAEKFAESLLPLAREISEREGLAEAFLNGRVAAARSTISSWESKLEAFDRGEQVFFEFPEGTKIRPVETREQVLEVIKTAQDVVRQGGRW